MKSRKKLFPAVSVKDLSPANAAQKIQSAQPRQNEEVLDSYFANVRIVKADSRQSYSSAGSEYIVEEIENQPSEFIVTPGPVARDIRVDYLESSKKIRTETKTKLDLRPFQTNTSATAYLKIEKDLSAFKYEAKDNRRIQQVAIARVFKKAGPYIFNLGLVNFFEFIIVNLLLVIRCYWAELKELEEIQKSSNTHQSLNFLTANVSYLF